MWSDGLRRRSRPSWLALALGLSVCLGDAACGGSSDKSNERDAVAALSRLRQPALAIVNAPLRVVREVDAACPDSSPPEVDLSVEGPAVQERLFESLQRHGWGNGEQGYQKAIGSGIVAAATIDPGPQDRQAVLTISVVKGKVGDLECTLPPTTPSPR